MTLLFPHLKVSGLVDKTVIILNDGSKVDYSDRDVSYIYSNGFSTTETVKKIAETVQTEFILLYTKTFPLDPGKFAIEQDDPGL